VFAEGSSISPIGALNRKGKNTRTINVDPSSESYVAYDY